MFKGFRDFILRGNVMDLAVAVIIGAAFTAIVTALTTKIISPLLGAFVGKPNFGSLVLHVASGQNEIRRIRKIPHRHRQLPHTRCRHLLLPRPANAISPEEVPSHRGNPTRHKSLPPVPQRHPSRSHPLQVLHSARQRLIARNHRSN